MANPTCPHCGSRTNCVGLLTDTIVFKCQRTGCRVTVEHNRREGIRLTGEPCVRANQGRFCGHQPATAPA
jgi:tRNA(Ile2) C34 agmatinyltransferase TiaS